jgi:hypothetical protein
MVWKLFFHTKHELPERIKNLPFGKMGRCPMDTLSPKCPFCAPENHPFSPNGEKGNLSDWTERKCPISRPFNWEVHWIQTYTPVWAIFKGNFNVSLDGLPIFEILFCLKRKYKF